MRHRVGARRWAQARNSAGDRPPHSESCNQHGMTEEHLVLANAPQAVYSILGCGMCSRRYRTALPSDGTLSPESRHQGRGDTCARGNTGNEEKTLSAIGQSSRSFVTGRTVVARALPTMAPVTLIATYAI